MTGFDQPPRRTPALPLVLAGAAFALALWMTLDRAGIFTSAPKGTPREVAPRGELAQYEKDLIAVREKVAPSVAQIASSELVRGWRGSQEIPVGSGSGFVWDKSGTVITNFHVVRDPESPPQRPRAVDVVRVGVGGRDFEAEVVNASPAHDLAVLRLRGKVDDLVPIEIGTSKDLQVGQTAIAIGAPFGLQQSMTTGIVSALNRTMQTKEGNLLYGMIQVDAAINPGNSGGPLLDSAGRLIGVNTAIYSPSGASAGIGFAVPVDTVNDIVPRLIAGRPVRAVLGVNDDGYGSVTLPSSTGFRSGAIITHVEPGYGAAAAGLRPTVVRETRNRAVVEQWGDIIVAIDGRPIRSFEEISMAVQGHKPGEKVRVKVVRGLDATPRVEEVEVALKAWGEGDNSGM
jgi:S1-C subfamily serine protease